MEITPTIGSTDAGATLKPSLVEWKLELPELVRIANGLP